MNDGLDLHGQTLDNLSDYWAINYSPRNIIIFEDKECWFEKNENGNILIGGYDDLINYVNENHYIITNSQIFSGYKSFWFYKFS